MPGQRKYRTYGEGERTSPVEIVSPVSPELAPALVEEESVQEATPVRVPAEPIPSAEVEVIEDAGIPEIVQPAESAAEPVSVMETVQEEPTQDISQEDIQEGRKKPSKKEKDVKAADSGSATGRKRGRPKKLVRETGSADFHVCIQKRFAKLFMLIRLEEEDAITNGKIVEQALLDYTRRVYPEIYDRLFLNG